jgi:broad specificity phosphatase PhoE
LTNHGVLQTQRLGQYLAASNVRFTKIFSSDLQRARITANAIGTAQSALQPDSVNLSTNQLQILREQDFGFFEAKPWTLRLPDVIGADDPRNDPDFKDKETQESIDARANLFLDDHLLPLLLAERQSEGEQVVAVVSHGVTLSVLWRCLLLRFSPQSVTIAPDVNLVGRYRPLEYLPGWTNTGYLELEIRQLNRNFLNDVASPQGPTLEKSSPFHSESTTPARIQLPGCGMVVKTVNGKAHLNNLKRTRGGVGSATHDERQQKLEGFFKKDTSM